MICVFDNVCIRSENCLYQFCGEYSPFDNEIVNRKKWCYGDKSMDCVDSGEQCDSIGSVDRVTICWIKQSSIHSSNPSLHSTIHSSYSSLTMRMLHTTLIHIHYHLLLSQHHLISFQWRIRVRLSSTIHPLTLQTRFNESELTHSIWTVSIHTESHWCSFNTTLWSLWEGRWVNSSPFSLLSRV